MLILLIKLVIRNNDTQWEEITKVERHVLLLLLSSIGRPLNSNNLVYITYCVSFVFCYMFVST